MQPLIIHIIKQKQPFARTYKKLPAAKKKLVKEAILTIDKNPEVGTEKKQDLKGIYVYKFKIDNTLMLLAYTFDPKTLTLILLGVHENYYRDLKKYLNKYFTISTRSEMHAIRKIIFIYTTYFRII